MQLEQDVPHPPGTNGIDFQRKQFLAERIGWVAMALFLGWALLGGFGEGWLSRHQTWNEDGTFGLDYERYGRRGAPMVLRLQLRPETSRDEFTLHLNREFVDGVEIQRITPDYRSMAVDADGVTLAFEAEASTEYSIAIAYKPRHAGSLPVAMRALSNAETVFEQFIYP